MSTMSAKVESAQPTIRSGLYSEEYQCGSSDMPQSIAAKLAAKKASNQSGR